MQPPRSLSIEQVDTGGATIFGGCYSLFALPNDDPAGHGCDESDGALDGTVVLSGLDARSYRAFEIDAPAGYQPASEITVDLAPGSATVTATHKPLPVLGVRVETSTGHPVAGACWKVHFPGEWEGPLAVACDGEDGADDGVTHVRSLLAGDYELANQSLPEGWDRIRGFRPFTLGEDGAEVVYVF